MQLPFAPKKSLGQNFLTNPTIAAMIAKAVDIHHGDTVFEVGPGTGMLTRELLKAGAHVVALEADLRAVETLHHTFRAEIGAGALSLIHGDIRTTSLADLPLPQHFKVAANIPYYLSGMLFETLLSGEHQPETLVFLVQKEVAERIARSDKESVLSLSVKAYGTPTYVQTVGRGNFRPVPNVDSAVLKVGDISRTRFTGINEASFFRLLKAGFSARRKQLQGNLSAVAPKEDVLKAFSALGIPPDVRGEDLSIDTWLELAKRLT